MNSLVPGAILMIRPKSFGYNQQTSLTNFFQKNISGESAGALQDAALKEFNGMVAAIRKAGAKVIVADDSILPVKPDAIFPNNWLSTRPDGTVIIYPLQAENRRPERRVDLILALARKYGYDVRSILDLSGFEQENKFLEGTGSMVFDPSNNIAYAAISPRTHPDLLELLSKEGDVQICSFHASDRDGREIYHTNVMMCIGTGYAVICLDSIVDTEERWKVEQSLKNSGLELIGISLSQMHSYAGNMMEVQGESGERLLVMSKTAHDVLSPEQLDKLSQYARPVFSDISTIESVGGGSARCMMAGIFLPVLRK